MSIPATARAIGVHRSTLYRELRRNASGRRATSQTMRISTPPTDGPVRPNLNYLPMSSSFVIDLPGWWSPEQISAGADSPHGEVTSGYTAMWPPTKARVASWHRHLRQGPQALPQRASSLRSPIEARSIDERPAIVDSREQLSDWEADTVLRKQGTGALVTWWSARAGSIWSSGSRANRLGWCGMR